MVNSTQMFMKLTDMTHGVIYCLITLKLRDKTHSKLNSLSVMEPLFIVFSGFNCSR